jgi:PAS domain S-box-containing protein
MAGPKARSSRRGDGARRAAAGHYATRRAWAGERLARYAAEATHRHRDADAAGDAERRMEDLEDEIWRLREFVERYRSVLATSGDAVLRLDGERRIVFLNEGFERLFGLDETAVLGRCVEDVVAGLTLSSEGRRHELNGGTDLRLDTATGPRWFALREFPVSLRPGDPAVTQVVIGDVSDRRAIEQELRRARDLAEAASAAKSRFLALASHEIRTPLNGILGMADLLLDTPLTSEQATYARAVRMSGEALLSLVTDVLDFGRIESGRLDLEPAPASIEDTVQDVVELLAPRAQAKGLELVGSVDPLIPAAVQIDGTRLRQVLHNLAGNAVKFTERGGVVITARRLQGADPVDPRRPASGAVADTRCRLRFEVTDTGIGIAAKDQARIFDEYEQADHGPTRRYGGTGLGLAISRAIVRRMGSDVDVTSEPGRGSTFGFTLTAEVSPASLGPSVPTGRPLTGRRVLIVSPAEIEPKLLRARLEDWGATVRLVSGADRGSGGERIDAALIDHHPGQDAAAALAALAASGRPPPAAVLLAPHDRRSLDRLKDAGFVGWLVKPVRSGSLLKVVTALTEGRSVAADALDRRLPARRPSATQVTENARASVLVADDNPINALLARALLEGLGHDVTLARDGAEAVTLAAARAAEGQAYDLILMDLHMPVLDGYAAIRQIRDAEAGSGRRSAIVALTADTTKDTEHAARSAGADGRLIKPVDQGAISAILAELVQGPRAG